MLNIIWCCFFIVGGLFALFNGLWLGKIEVFSDMLKNIFEMSDTAFDISIGLTGVMAFWLGILKVGQDAGMIQLLSNKLSPFMRKLFPGIPENHPALSSILMNLAANMLGIDNAATPFGLKAMQELEEINPNKGTASDPQIMFLVINAASVTIIPLSVFTFLYQLNYPNPTDVFFPILLTTFIGTFFAVVVTCFLQKIPFIKNGLLWFFLLAAAAMAGIYFGLKSFPPEQMQAYSVAMSNFIIVAIVIFFITHALFKKINVFDSFIQGAKDGFQVAVGIIPYLVAMLVGIGVFRASGALDGIIGGLRYLIGDYAFIDALPTAFMKPLSGSGSRAMMIETIKTHGVDSLVAKMVAIIQGSNETTFYVLAVYYGSVKTKFTKYTLSVSLLCDLVGIIFAILFTYLFFT
ncbi:MAG: hypothetical protein JNM93_05810 [Bacteriovoracaceae bacterium]|nr:hypothetical protein [Bacteriovoracaceae bacterium]